MIVSLSAEPLTDGLIDYSTGRPILIDEFKLSNRLKKNIQNWHRAYQKYLPLNIKELSEFVNEVEELDNEGLNLLEQINAQVHSNTIEKFYYTSFCNNNFTFVIYRDGTKRKL